VSGESLRDRLSREKQLPVDDAVRLAREVASALDYAHRQGVVHRDIKPENILLQEGSALVADFGIALAVQHASGSRMTQTGMSLGTPAYMSPEQAMGERVIGPRSDVYALGAMTYEMLVGDPPFTGSTVQAIVAKVMTEKPMPPSRIRDTIPPSVEHAVLTALQKLPADRYSTAKDFADALDGKSGSATYAATVLTPGARPARLARLTRPVILATIALISTAAVAGWLLRGRPRAAEGPTLRFPLGLPPEIRIATPITNPVAISPDGGIVAFSGRLGDGSTQIFVRRLNDLAVEALPGTEGGEQPFFSPDGRTVAFFANHQVKKVDLTGGSVSVLTDLPRGLWGASWAPDGRIVASLGNSLMIIPAGGGPPIPLSPTDTATDRLLMNPKVLRDGRTVIATRWRGSTVSAGLWMAPIGEGSATDLQVPGSYFLGMIDNYLVYDTQTGTLMAVPFDLGKRKVMGPPISVLDGIAVGANGAAQAALSANGTLVYQTGALLRHVVLTDLHGTVTSTIGEPNRYAAPRFSPDGSRIALSLLNQGTADVWVYDLRSQTLGRITSEGNVNDRADWTPDGKRVVFRSNRSGPLALWTQPVNGTGKAELLLRDPEADIWEGLITPDGRSVIYRTGTIGTGDIWIRDLAGDTTRRPLANNAFTEWSPRASPDGKWLAYESSETGDFQVYVRPITGDGRLQVSVDGGVEPVWSPDGKRLFYRQGDDFMAATLAFTPELAVTGREKFFKGDYPVTTGHANYDVSPDGKHLLLLPPVSDSVRAIVVYDWATEFRAKIAAAGK
jgi:serine/threonine-protein kinase